jgi:hypothetical protein
MAKNELSDEATAHVVELPEYLRNTMRSSMMKTAKIGETLKLLGRDKALSYDQSEFEREFGTMAKFKAQLIQYLKKDNLRVRIVLDKGKYIVFANETQQRKTR